MRQINIFRRKKQQHEIPQPQQQEASSFNLPDFEKLTGKYDAVIHIGAPGTGSAAIQKFLFDNHSRLNDLGFYYPVHHQNNNSISYGHAKLGSYFEKNDLASAKSLFDSYLAEAKQNNLTLVLSAKSLYGHPDQLKEVTLEKKCKILAFFRDPLESLFSHYNQTVKHDFVTTTFAQFCQSLVSSDNDRLTGKVFKQWRECYSRQNLLVLGYDPSVFKQIRIEMLFLAALGIDKNLFSTFHYTEERINPSHDFLTLELRRWLNFVIDEELFYYNHKIDWLLQHYSRQLKKTPEFFIQEHIPQELYLSLKDKFKETNHYLLHEILTHPDPNFLVDNSSSDNTLSGVRRNRYDDGQLKNILETIMENDVTTKQYIINRTTKALPTKSSSYYVLRLAELLGIDIQPYLDTFSDMTEPSPLFTRAQINNVFLSETSQPVNFLKEIAISMERHGDYKSALLVIGRLVELHTNRRAMMAWHDRIQSKI